MFTKYKAMTGTTAAYYANLKPKLNCIGQEKHCIAKIRLRTIDFVRMQLIGRSLACVSVQYRNKALHDKLQLACPDASGVDDLSSRVICWFQTGKSMEGQCGARK
mmetsp:Transcript_10020/g.30905  ORF Transcript_10020/g.30905 Transcript_10020/m.30905 type:complete len:105 (+) Transcript_10020:72-386(+)